MKVWNRKELQAIVDAPKFKVFLDYIKSREARPRRACSDCQFEYVVEDGHECDTRQGTKET